MDLPSDILLADVAVVWFDQEEGHNSFGSGRLIAPGLVLTAGHIVDCPARESPIRDGWKVRLIRDRPWRGEPRAAKVIWRHPNRLDLALLQIDNAVLTAGLPLAYSQYDLSNPLKDTSATGFPEARWNEFQEATDYSLHGTLRIAAQEGPFAWTVSPGDAPDRPQGWKGMSGAVVIYAGCRDRVHLLGVVESVPKNFTSGQLSVARLADAFNDPKFKAIIGDAVNGRVPLVRFAEPHPDPRRDGALQHWTATSAVLDYVQRAIEFVRRQPVSRAYVWPKISLSNCLAGTPAQIVEARTCLTSLMNNPNGCSLVVLGDYGSGKTSLCYMLGRELGEQALLDPERSPIPLYLNLKKLRPDDTVFDAISRSLADYGAPVSAGDLRQLAAARPHLVLFLDGLDEAGDRSTLPQMGSILAQLKELREIPGLRWLLTVRTTFFSSDMEVSLLDADFVAQLQPFSEEEVMRYFEDANLADSPVLAAIIKGNRALLELCQTPVHLYLLVSVLRADEAPVLVERWSVDLLYDQFIRYSIKVNFTARLSHWRVDDRLSILRQLAFHWFGNRIYEWKLQHFRSFLEVRSPELLDADLTSRSEFIANCSFFTRAHDKFRFIHLSIMEYLAAWHLVEEFFAGQYECWEEPLYSEVYEFVALIIRRRSTDVSSEAARLMANSGIRAQANFTATAFRHLFEEIVPYLRKMAYSPVGLHRALSVQGLGLYPPTPENVDALLDCARVERNGVVSIMTMLVASYWTRNCPDAPRPDELRALAARTGTVSKPDAQDILGDDIDEGIIRAYRKSLVQVNAYWTAPSTALLVLVAADDRGSFEAIRRVANETRFPEVARAFLIVRDRVCLPAAAE